MKIALKSVIIAICVAGTNMPSYSQDTVWVRKNAPTQKETYAVSFSADGSKVFSGSECSPSYLRIFNSATGNITWDYELGSSLMCVQGVKLSSDGTKAAAMEEMGNLLIFDYSTATPTLTHTVSTGTSGAFALDFSPEGNKIVTGCISKKMNIYNFSDGSLLHSVDAHSSWVLSVDWSSAGGQIVSGGSDNLVKLWDTAGNLIRTMTGHTGAVQSVKFSIDGQYIISASKDKKIKIWETATGNLIRTISGHTGFVMQADISDDGTKIVSGSEDSTIRVWNFNTGTQTNSFRLPQGGKVYTVDISPDGRYVAAGTSTGDVQLWDLEKTTGINDISKDGSLATVYPNPVFEQLFIKAEGKKIYSAIVSDMTGKVVFKQTVDSDEARIKLDALETGYYILILDISGGRQTTKFYKR